jgi:hypothetical protein
VTISGAKYAGDPQKEVFNLSSLSTYLAKPKSVNKQLPFSSKTTFCGFKSLKIIKFL